MNVKDILHKASSSFEEGDLEGTERLCNSILEMNPRHARALYLLGAVEHRTGRIGASRLLEASRARPDLPMLQHSVGVQLQRQGKLAEALHCFQLAVKAEPSKPGFMLAEASALRKLGRDDEAITVLERAVAATSPALSSGGEVAVSATARYKLGQHLRSVGDYPRAVKAYRSCLEVHPGHKLAAFWLPATQKLVEAEGGATRPHHRPSQEPAGSPGDTPDPPQAAPVEYIVGLYETYANNFDQHLTVSLGYKTPEVLRGALEATLPGQRWLRCLDLGCGTGLSGEAIKPLCQYLVGIDLSLSMIEKAREKGTYDRLITGEGEGFRGEGDLFLSCDVFVYIGDLRECFRAVSRLAKWATGQTIFAFSTEACFGYLCSPFPSLPRSLILPSHSAPPNGRYAHSQAYLESLCMDAGFQVLLLKTEALRRQAGRPVWGYLCIAESRA
ncbi:unnamed protein product [Discosporangium mesarthrocarpum]